MSFHGTVNALLVADATLRALLGDRIYSLTAPADKVAGDYLVFNRVGNEEHMTHDDTSSGMLDHVLVQVDVFASRFANSEAIRDRARGILIAAMKGSTSDIRDTYLAAPKLYHSSCDLFLWFSAPAVPA